MDGVEAELSLSSLLSIEDMRRLLSSCCIPARALNRGPDGAYLPIRRDRVAFDRDRFEFERYQPEAPTVVNAYVLVLRDRFRDPADILAFRPDGAVGLWLGRVAMAGEEEVLAPRLDNPLSVQDSVMAWLRAGRAGIVILDQGRAASRLEGVPLRVGTGEHARRLRTALTRPAPRIMVAPSDAARAA